ncbi:MAG: DinB family protein, partial [Armatimonadetes bacterium]|nr:DinB family protein [Armatimonadota bacterium]
MTPEAAAEWAESVKDGRWGLVLGLGAIWATFGPAIFGGLSADDLQAKCTTPAGAEMTTWKWLRALVEHEIHHRGQIYIYLGMLDVETPP